MSIPSKKKQVPRIGIVSAMWQRLELADIVFSNIAHLRKQVADVIDILPVTAGSEGEKSRTVALRHGFAYIECPNSPLGAKWNASLSLLKNQDIDGIVIVGSDDLMNEAYLRFVASTYQQGFRFFGVDYFYCLDRFSGRMFRWMSYPPGTRHDEPIGLGRFIHRDYIERVEWQLWEDDKEKGLDLSMWSRQKKLSQELGEDFACPRFSALDHDLVLIDIKHVTQMWSFETMATSSYKIQLIGEPRKFLGKYFSQDLVETVMGQNNVSTDDGQDILLPQILPPIDKEKHICLWAPAFPWLEVLYWGHQIATIGRLMRARGYRVSLMTNMPLADYPEFSMIDFFLTGDCYEAQNLFDNNFAPWHGNDPQVIMVFGSGWYKLLPNSKDINRMKQAFPKACFITDLRVAAPTEFDFLVKNVDQIIINKNIVIEENTNKQAQIVPRICLAYNNLHTSFSLRNAISIYGFDSKTNQQDIIDAYIDADIFQQGKVYLHFSQPESITLDSTKGMIRSIVGHLQIYTQLYRVYIMAFDCSHDALCAEIWASGVPIICHENMARILGLSSEEGVFGVTSYKDAMEIAAKLHNDQDLWEQCVKNIFTLRSRFNGKILADILEKV